VSPRVREDTVHPRLQSGASVRPLNFTVRGTLFVSSAEIRVSTSLGGSQTLRCRGAGQLGERLLDAVPLQAESVMVARRCGSARISLSSFGECPSIGVGAARRRAASQCQ
jgi:hypothetical protein